MYVLLARRLSHLAETCKNRGKGLDFYKIPPERILVISDDTALAPGRLRIRKGGSAGGHNGLKNIIDLSRILK